MVAWKSLSDNSNIWFISVLVSVNSFLIHVIFLTHCMTSECFSWSWTFWILWEFESNIIFIFFLFKQTLLQLKCDMRAEWLTMFCLLLRPVHTFLVKVWYWLILPCCLQWKSSLPARLHWLIQREKVGNWIPTSPASHCYILLCWRWKLCSYWAPRYQGRAVMPSRD